MIERALITAGGRATRLRPITHTMNKHLIPLANRPMIFYAIDRVVEVGIKEIAINVNLGETEIQKFVGDGSRWGVRVQYIEQVGGPLGLAHIIRNAEPIIGRAPFLFLLGDNLILGGLQQIIDQFNRDELDICLAFVHVEDPRRFGVPEFRDGKLVRIVEKPTNPPSNFAQTGIYVYSPAIFDAVSAIQPSARGEYEISDANTYLI
ncbi:MAG: sugar phosphate nucleotidyltransferase, partial [Candidatus Uhrbacteria bacterium]